MITKSIKVFDRKFTNPFDKNSRVFYTPNKYNSVVYKHIVPNGKVYYGITRQKPYYKRWAKGKGYVKNKKFYKDIEFFGWDNIKHEKVCDYINLYIAFYIEYAYIIRDKTYLEEYGYNHEKTDIHYFLQEYTTTKEDKDILNYILTKIANTTIEQLKK